MSDEPVEYPCEAVLAHRYGETDEEREMSRKLRAAFRKTVRDELGDDEAGIKAVMDKFHELLGKRPHLGHTLDVVNLLKTNIQVTANLYKEK